MENDELIQKKLNDAQEFNKNINSYLDKNFLIDGKTMRQWKKELHINIPEDINFASLVNICRDISIKYQRAAYYRDAQQVHLSVLEEAKSDKYNTEYNLVRSDTQAKTGKALAAESCKVAATLAVKDLESAIANQRIIHTFWCKTCDTLTEVRKLVDTIGYGLSGDARIQRDMVIKHNH
jgi:hypothetical protein